MQDQILGDRYRIIERIGEGGMAFVYLALDEKLGRKVAIKVLHEHMEQNPDIRQRFQQEAQAVSMLDHPNIVKVYDYSGDTMGRLWIVTEVIRGKNLAQYVQKYTGGWLPIFVATALTREIAKALEKAHNHAIVHRDVKPENVMVTTDGRIKLMDFGIAKNLKATSMTVTGTFMGSPSYMSPEQIRGKDVDHKTDIYSLSVLFYEIVTGRLPFTGQSTHEVVLKIVNGGFAHPKYILPTLPDVLNDFIVKGMALDSANRHQSAMQYGKHLDAILRDFGFDESHIELERYFKNPEQYEARMQNILARGRRDMPVHHTGNREAIEPTARLGKPPVSTEFQLKAQTEILAPHKTAYTGAQKTELITTGPGAQRPDIPPAAESYKTARQTSIMVPPPVPSPEMPRRRVKTVSPIVPHAKPRRVPRKPARRPGYRPDVPIVKTLIYKKQSPLSYVVAMLIVITAGLYTLTKVAKNKGDEVNTTVAVKPTVNTPAVKPPLQEQPKPPTIEELPSPEGENPVSQAENSKPAKKPGARVPTPKRKKPEEVNAVTSVKSGAQPTKRDAQPKKIATLPGTPAVNKAKVSTVEPLKKPVEAPPASVVKTTPSASYIQLSSQPAGEIFVDGKRLGTTVDQTTSSGWLQIAPGSHKIEIRRLGYQPIKTTVDVKTDERKVIPKFTMTTAQAPETNIGSLTIRTNRRDWTAEIKAIPQGQIETHTVKGPAKTVKLQSGRYLIKIVSQGEVLEREVQVSEGALTYSADFKGEKEN